MTVSRIVVAAFLLGSLAPADAAILINEILINHSSNLTAADDDREFLEFRSTTGGVEAMAGLTFLYIEGDGGNTGVIDFALDLSPYSTGTNGLVLFTDGLTAWDPAADPATPINAVEFVNDDGGGDDLENGSSTYAIVTGFTGAGGDDLDTDNDGVLDATPWDSVVSVVGWTEASTSDEFSYAAALGGTTFTGNNGLFDPDAYVFAPDGEFAFDAFTTDDDTLDDGPWVVGTTGGRALNASDLVVGNFNPLFTMTPGSANSVSFTPEPGSLAMAGLATFALLARQRR
ncbi:PEP-CTERM sorting domain-containing protein [Botrimarina hoheduenensis]|uniref:Ice-binding protein C-terminal domain-containing protein n=1 Tax=Botrimarina hoheduenensis TaxID=2528000 RepID=A0A5C5VUQ1_9BACT|nr:PEP-CTERM sorting domain-containing protein [Botrimarina hoheduenensis]TWT41331.1 hypothetical protein Pla111_30450 [Botrimarina hoheduenensis]